MGLFWGTHKRRLDSKNRPSKIKQMLNFLETEIDLTAPVPDFKRPAKELIISATTKLFCAQCSARLDYQTHQYYEGYCKFCYNQLFPDKPKKRLYRKSQIK